MRRTNLRQIILLLPLCLQLAARADVTFAWNPATGANITNYTVYWGTNSGAYTFDLPNGTQTTVTITGLTPGGVYYFSVQAEADDGTLSPFSNEVCYTNPATVLPPTPPGGGGGGGTTGGTAGGSGGSTNGSSGGGGSGGTGNVSSSGGGGSGGSGSSGGSGASGSSLSLNGSTSEYAVPGIPPTLTLGFSNNAPLLNIAGTVGASFAIQSSTNPFNPDGWNTISNLSVTNVAAGVATNSDAPSAVNLAFVPGSLGYQVMDSNPPASEFYRVVMPYDYMVLADSVLTSQGDPSRLVLVVMPGTPSDDICYVTPQNSFLFYDSTNRAFALEPSGSTIRQIATTLSTSLGQNWTSASEFAYSNGVSTILATVVETEPASSDPVAGASTPSITIDF